MRSAIAAVLLFTTAAFAQSTIPNNPGKKPKIAIRNATIVPVTADTIAKGNIVFENGIIIAIGPNITIPPDAAVVDGAGLYVYPGMIDSGSNIGLVEMDSVPGTVDTAELGDINPNARAAVAINPHSEVVPVTRVNGVTNAIVVPEGGIISGQSALVQLAGWTPAEMVLKAPVAMNIRFPRLRSAPLSGTPQDEEAEKEQKKSYTKALDQLRDVMRDAQAYAKAMNARASDKNVQRFDRDPILEALVPVVEGPAEAASELLLATLEPYKAEYARSMLAALRAKLGPAKFFSATYRLFKLDGLEPLCEDYGQAVIYKGGIPHAEDVFVLDKHHVIERGKVFPVCGNTWRMLADTRFAGHFEFIGDFSRHYGIFAGCGTPMPFETGGGGGVASSCC